jgi:hypothetical protein
MTDGKSFDSIGKWLRNIDEVRNENRFIWKIVRLFSVHLFSIFLKNYWNILHLACCIHWRTDFE